MPAGLPKEYVEKYGMTAEAWQHFRADTGTTSTSKPKKGASMALKKVAEVDVFAGGGGSAHTHSHPSHRSTGSSIHASIPFVQVREVDKAALGSLLYGLLLELKGGATGELQQYFPPGSTGNAMVQTQPNAAPLTGAALAVWNHGAGNRETGREMGRALGFGLAELGITQAQWNAFYPRAMSIMRAQLVAGGNVSGAGAGGFLAPLGEPTVVTQAFGPGQDGQFHRGVDLRAAVGTPVLSPWTAMVDWVGVDNDGGGNVVRLAIQRPDGVFPNNTLLNTGNDSGLLVSMLHLQDATVTKGQVVGPGDVIGHSGNSGVTTGPHLHMMVELVEDTAWWSFDPDGRRNADPLTLWGGEAQLTGNAPPSWPYPPSGTTDVALPAVDVSSIGIRTPFTTVIDHNTGTINVVSGGGTAVQTNLKAILPLGEFGTIGGTGDGSGGPPPHVAQAAQQLGAQQIISGIPGSALAGQFFGLVMTAAGPVGRFLGSAVQAAASAVGTANRLLGITVGPATQVLGGAAVIASPFLGAVNPALGAAAGTIGGVLGGVGSVASILAPPAVTVSSQVVQGGADAVAALLGVQPYAQQTQQRTLGTPGTIYLGPQP